MASAAALALRSSIGRPMTWPSTWGSAQRSMIAPESSARCGSDIRFALAAERDHARVRELARDLQDLALRALHLGDAHGSFGFEIVLEHLGGALRHVLEDLVLQVVVRALQRK